MKNHELRSSLIKSGIILLLCIFFIYAFASADSGGISGTIASIFSAIVFLVGLSLSVAVSIVVMFGLYFGVLYLYNPETCSTTYGEMKTLIGELSESMGCSCCCSSVHSPSGPIPIRPEGEESKTTSRLIILENQVTDLQKELITLQDKLDHILNGTTEATAQRESIEGRLSTVQSDLAHRPTSIALDATTSQTTAKIGEIQDNLSSVKRTISELESSMSSLQTKISEFTSPNTTSTENGTSNDTDHRILSYFTNNSDAKQFTTKVATAVKKGMTYAEISEFLDDSLSGEASEVISDHPSLTKDYIRTCRQGS